MMSNEVAYLMEALRPAPREFAEFFLAARFSPSLLARAHEKDRFSTKSPTLVFMRLTFLLVDVFSLRVVSDDGVKSEETHREL